MRRSTRSSNPFLSDEKTQSNTLFNNNSIINDSSNQNHSTSIQTPRKLGDDIEYFTSVQSQRKPRTLLDLSER